MYFLATNRIAVRCIIILSWIIFMSNLHTTQRLGHSTLDRVKKYGKMGESFDEALSKLLDRIEEEEKDGV